jgi:glutamate-1-semialdehyde 2,1-aminomutase
VHDGRNTDPYPIYVTHAKGPRKWDVDGHGYVDYFGGHGSLILGHCHPTLIAAVGERLLRGTHFGACHELEIQWAQLIRQLIPSAASVRFTSSGTEATLLAVRVARAFTGRPILIRVKGHFHGWNDHMTSGYTSHFDGTPTRGVLDAVAANVVLVEPDDIPALRVAFDRDDIAAAIVEPMGAHFGRIPLSDAFLRELRKLTAETGALLIFDEVVTGFRTAPGGYQSVVGIKPDITTLAKILAGGLPGGAVAGRADVLDVMDFKKFRSGGSERVGHQGTYNANPLSAAAGVAMLSQFGNSQICDRASATAAALRARLNEVLERQGIPWAVYGRFSGFNIFTNPKGRSIKPSQFDTSILRDDVLGSPANPNLLSKIRMGLLANGVDITGAATGWVSATHGEPEIADTVAAFEALVSGLRRDGDLA